MKTDLTLHSRIYTGGFTRADLFAALFTSCLVALVLFTTAATSATRGRYAVCLNNHKQLVRAWLVYAEDNNDKLPGNLDGGSNIGQPTWCAGWLNNSAYTPDNTNTLIIMNSQLGRYSGSVGIYKCPADKSMSRGPRGDPRVRSVSMNAYLGERGSPYTGGYYQFRKYSSLNSPSPSKCWVFVDEREDGINDGWFAVDMGGYVPRDSGLYTWADYPADRHDGAANLSFADGHAETWRWRDPRTRPFHRLGVALPLTQPSPDNVDVARLQEATSRPVR